MNLLGYVRVSTDGQEDNTSIENQSQSIESYCEARRWTLDDLFVDVASGKDFERKAFKAMIDRLHLNGVDGVIVYRYDRLSRSPVDGRLFTDQLEKRGKAFLSVQDNIDTSTPLGRAMFTMMLTFAEMERSIIVERMTNGKNQRVKQGKRCSGFVYGYRWNGTGSEKRLEPDECEEVVVKRIYQLYIKTHSYQSVANSLNEAGMRTRRGNPWSRFGVRKIIRNKTYLGVVKYQGQEFKGSHPPVVSKYIFQKANCGKVAG